MRTVVGRHHALAFIDQHQGEARIVPVDAIEDPLHLVGEPEAQDQYADRGVATGAPGDPLRVEQRSLPRSAQVAVAEPFYVAVLCQRLGDQRIVARLQACPLVQPREHAAVGPEQDDVVVYRVLRLVFSKPTHHCVPVCLAAIGVGAERTHHVIGGQEAHIGGALEEVAHQDVDRALGLGCQFVLQRTEILAHHQFDHPDAQAVEALPGAQQGRQDGCHCLRTADRSTRFDHLPYDEQVAQVVFARLNPGHVGDEVVRWNHRAGSVVQSAITAERPRT